MHIEGSSNLNLILDKTLSAAFPFYNTFIKYEKAIIKS